MMVCAASTTPGPDRRIYRALPRGDALRGPLRRAYGATPEPDIFAILLNEIDRADRSS